MRVESFLGEDMTSVDKVEKMKNGVITLTISLPFSFSSLAEPRKLVSLRSPAPALWLASCAILLAH